MSINAEIAVNETVETETEEFTPQQIFLAEKIENGPFGPIVQALAGKVKEANGKIRAIREAQTGDKEKIDSILNNHENFEAYRAKLADILKAEEDLANLKSELIHGAKSEAKSLVPELSSINIDDEKAQVTELRKLITATKSTVAGLVGEEDLAAWIAVNGVEELVGYGKTSTGAKKYRFQEIEVNGEFLEAPTLTEVGKKFGIPQDVVRTALITAAGTDDLKSKAGSKITFGVQHDGKNFGFSVVPK